MGSLLPPAFVASLVEMIANGLRNVNLGALASLVEGLAAFFTWFDLSIEVEALGVTCNGAKAPPLLIIAFILTAGVIILFDSNMYFVAKTGGSELDLHQSEDGKKKYSELKTKAMRLVLFGAAGGFRKLVNKGGDELKAHLFS